MVDRGLTRRQRIAAIYIISLTTLILLMATGYYLGMRHIENRPRTFIHSLQIVIETWTTTGYGSDSPWSDTMTIYIIFMHLTGLAAGFVSLRLLVAPLLDRTDTDFAEHVPKQSGHAVICGYQRDTDVLIEELDDHDIGYVIVEENQETARKLFEDDYNVVHGDASDAETLRDAYAKDARVVIAETGQDNVGVIVTVKQFDGGRTVIALTDEPERQVVYRRAGADIVLAPHVTLGEAMGGKAATTLLTGDTQFEVSNEFTVAEVPVHAKSEYNGQALSAITPQSDDVRVVGAWIDGELTFDTDTETELSSNSVLFVAGIPEAVTSFEEDARPTRVHERVVVLGNGTVGRSATETLRNNDIEAVTVDEDSSTSPDIVGDVTQEAVLNKAAIADATGVLVCVPDDDEAMFASVLTRTLAPDVETICRITDPENVPKAFDAEADFVLSDAHITARSISRELLGDGVMYRAAQARVETVEVELFSDRTPADVYAETDCMPVAITSNNSTRLLNETEEIPSEGMLVIAGTDTDLNAIV